jgi:hypothetical protein
MNEVKFVKGVCRVLEEGQGSLEVMIVTIQNLKAVVLAAK